MAQAREMLRAQIDDVFGQLSERLAFLKSNYSEYTAGFKCLETVINDAFNKYWSGDPPEVNDNDLKNFRNALLIINGQTGLPGAGTLERLYLLNEEYRRFPTIHNNPIIEEMLKQFVVCIEDDDTKGIWIGRMNTNKDQTRLLVQQSLPASLNGGKRHHKKGGKKSHKKGGNKKSHKRSHKKSHKKRSHKRRH